MARVKKTQGTKTSIEIVMMPVVRQRCIRIGKSLKDYINDLIKNDMQSSDTDLKKQYFGEGNYE